MKLIILDRDGVINEDSDFYIKNPDEFIPIKKSLDAIVALKKASWTVVIWTNQSGIGRGLYSKDDFFATIAKLDKLLEKKGVKIDGVFYCPHKPQDNCSCRKPKTSLLYDIGKKFNIDITKSIIIGDSLRDIQAARSVGATSYQVLTGKGAKHRKEHKQELQKTICFEDLFGAVDYILEKQNE
jgi:D-glycero-D-manno-heptose 1,7-bisphosphate phosphatase